MQRKARPQVGCLNARLQRKRKARPHVRKLGAPTQCKARPQVGRPNATQGEFARWAPKVKTHSQRKRQHKGALGKKTSWRMDKNKFWLGGRLFKTASPRLGAAMQRKARPQNGHPNATHDTSARWAPKRKNRSATKTSTQGNPNARPQRKHKARPHVRKLGAPTQCKAHPHNGALG
jgi:hypothetical protein